MGKGLLAAGGLLSALAASTCCVLPLSLGALGVSSASVSLLTILAPYELAFRVAGILMLAAGFWFVYAPRKAAAETAACSTAAPARFTKAALWAGAAVMAVVLLSRWWTPMINVA